ncbi:MAG: hypothetical protein JSS64_12655 [Bacteroidetes bacterium]|nr:hypothetical protein [Bacteroidota bacterium]
MPKIGNHAIFFSIFSFIEVQIPTGIWGWKPLIILITILFSISASVQAQKKVNLDSVRLARQQAIEANQRQQQLKLDSARNIRKHQADSVSSIRKHIADSLSRIRKYRESKRFQDSVSRIRQHRIDSVKKERNQVFNAQRAIRQNTMDSLAAIRKHNADSIHSIQLARSKALERTRKYRSSKRFADSVAVVRRIHLDSVKQVRKAANEKVMAERKRSLDSAMNIRKHTTDSLSAIRKHFSDSIKIVRKQRADSLAKIKDSKERLKKSNEKKQEDKMKLALELKIKQKRQAWSNEKMLKKKWSLPRRVIQNTYTHYNYYFNADKKMDEALLNMQRGKHEDYDSLLALFPFDPNKDSTKLAPDMDSIIRKASVGIQIHDPRTKWADDLYLLLGQAYYYKGNYPEAITAFRYIIAINQKRKAEEQKKLAAKKKPIDKDISVLEDEKKSSLDFLKHKPVNNEAILWMARTYTQSGQENDAESILELIETDKNVTEDLKGRIALEKAYLNLSRKDFNSASENLTIVADDAEMPHWLQTRAAYLNGQLLYKQGKFEDAAKHFQMVVDLKPKIDLDFYARKNLAYSLLKGGGSQEEATVSLRKMLKDGKYIPYYEQIYYVMGMLSANVGNTSDAISYFQKGISTPKATRKQKALSFAALGDVYYKQTAYAEARNSYDSAMSYGKQIASDPEMITAAKRARALDKAVIPLQLIADQDSLLRLSEMSEKDQLATIRHYIKLLEKHRADSILQAANAENNPKSIDEDGQGSNSNWYFSSTVMMQQGLNDFKRKWGNRPNVDDWRRIAATNLAANNKNIQSGDNTSVSSEANDDQGLPTEASLMVYIPIKESAKNKAHTQQMEAYIALADAYVNDLEDMPRGSQTLDTLDKRFPNHPHQAEELHLRYLIALKQNHLDDAQKYSARLRSEYPETKWAKDVAPTRDPKLTAEENAGVANFYDETYGLMMQRQYEVVLQRAKEGQAKYSDPIYEKRFRIMEAIALTGLGNFEKADTLLTNFISASPSDSLKNWADVILQFVKTNKPVAHPILDTTINKQIVPNTTTVTASKPTQPTLQPTTNTIAPPTNYVYKPASEHYFIFYFSKMESRVMGLKAGLNDFNTFNFSGQKLAVSLDVLKPDQGVILVKSFANSTQARIYLNAVRANNVLLKQFKPEDYTLMIISAENFEKLNTEKDMMPYVKFYKSHY